MWFEFSRDTQILREKQEGVGLKYSTPSQARNIFESIKQVKYIHTYMCVPLYVVGCAHTTPPQVCNMFESIKQVKYIHKKN